MRTDWTLVPASPQMAAAGIKTYIRVDDAGVCHVRKTQAVQDTLDINAIQANAWGGWQGREDAVVARIPTIVWNDWKQSGKIDERGEDTAAVNRMLNDSDFRKLRTGGGQL